MLDFLFNQMLINRAIKIDFCIGRLMHFVNPINLFAFPIRSL